MRDQDLHRLKIEFEHQQPCTKESVISEIANWVGGDPEGAFDYAEKHGFIEKTGKKSLGYDLWQTTNKFTEKNLTPPETKALKAYGLLLKAKAFLAAKDDNGRWITTKTKQKVFIPEGKDTGEHLKEHFSKLKPKKSTVASKPIKGFDPIKNPEYKKLKTSIKNSYQSNYEIAIWDILEKDKDKDESLFNSHLLDGNNQLSGEYEIYQVERDDIEDVKSFYWDFREAVQNDSTGRRIQRALDRHDAAIENFVKTHKTVWRATDWQNVVNVVKSGKIGEGKSKSTRIMERDDSFISATADFNYVMANTRTGGKKGLMIEYDTSELKQGEDWDVLRHELRPEFVLNEDDKLGFTHIGETFGGSKGTFHLGESEVHLKPGAPAKIRRVLIPKGIGKGQEKIIKNFLDEYGIKLDYHPNLKPENMETLTGRPEEDIRAFTALQAKAYKLLLQAKALCPDSRYNDKSKPIT